MVPNKYNYVFLASRQDYYKNAFADCINLPNARYYTDNVFLNLKRNPLFRVHFGRLNYFIKLPLKKIWNSSFCKRLSFENEKPICFIVWGDWPMYFRETDYAAYLRNKYPSCKIVWFLQDLFLIQKDLYGNNVDVKKEFGIYDLIISYDKGDCQKYGFTYHQTVMSYTKILDNEKIPNSDVLFIGKDKGRLDLLSQICRKLSDKGLICDFKFFQVPKKDQIKVDGISYFDEKMSYDELLQYTKKTKCLVELMQPGAHNFTFRTWEALIYDKFLITNNDTIIDSNYFFPDSMCCIKTVEDITDTFIEKIKNSLVQYNFRDAISPIYLLIFLEKNI